jgi:glycosyltransferase involved in cell wall biosynthesis
MPSKNKPPFRLFKKKLSPLKVVFLIDKLLWLACISVYAIFNGDFLTKLQTKLQTIQRRGEFLYDLFLNDLEEQEFFTSALTRKLYFHLRRKMSPYSNNYADWILKNEVPARRRLKGLLKNNFSFKKNPLISIIMPVFNPNKKWLMEAIESVQNQVYENWELCIADDQSADEAIKTFLNKVSEEDRRIKVFFRKKNGHISEASNSAISISTGKWIGLLDQDDLLAEDALFWVVAAINKKSNIKMIYSDEDKFSKSISNRFYPYFKPDWNLPLFYSHNFFSHFGVFQKDLVLDVGGFRKGFEGSQDYDLTLRCFEKVSSQDIFHIPKVLYHWRAHNQSTSKNIKSKSYASLAGKKALSEHFERLKIPVKVNNIAFGYRVNFTLPEKPPLVSIIVCTRNRADYLKRCISSLLDKTSYKNYEIILIDNGSDEKESLDYLSSLKKCKKIKIYRDNRAFNYSQLNNFGVKKAKGTIVALLNNDVKIINASWLDEMVSLASLKYTGAVGAKLYYPDKTLQHAGVVLGIMGVANHAFLRASEFDPGYMGRAQLRSSYSAVTGACLVVKKSIFNLAGGLDEKNLKIAFNDVDLCLKIREKGYVNIWTPYANLYHYESISRGKETPADSVTWKRFMGEVQFMKNKWKDVLLNDPCYSPNLTLENTNFSYALAPRKSPIDLII